MGFGTLAHTVGKRPLKELVNQLASYDIDFVQLALQKAIGDIDLTPGKLSPGLANYVAEQFDQAGIRIGVLGCYINPIHPDPEQRRMEIERFKEHLRYARDFGTSIVATETGNLDTFAGLEPEHYEEYGWNVLRSTVEELAEEAERWGVHIGLEPVSVHTLSSPAKMKRLLDEVPSSNLGVVFDPCNLMDQHNFERRNDIVDELFELVGDRVILAHLKDVVYRADGRPTSVKMGQGQFDIERFFTKLHARKPFVDISLEDTQEQDLPEVLRYVRGLKDAVRSR
ncbi:Sugar phosphate isomerase/epimerase [Paenibacillus sp. UNCCL117]|uniref:sugar phosphate isomerase/epimerase family protein n=1 Tax=unclassified Paenibacillus TaxID=185978 RepID=UPI00087F6857|nr:MULTISPECIES: sugar phosphate isomerase/epimerase family protein [unclassified Paenibacillus]SDD59549.1 Sugar phosphate isomerase/epimerase [Paenibacillus sp. cl123]SFW50787.1 Sugar phosphate isomerase/epimerase [Paenibacillus sp. UNCCL117]